ncbi:FAD-dependent oxidoreductase [soil metagenome]
MSNITNVDVLIVGGGAGGTAAAWQAARMGVSVLVAEESPWLGGMITAAGVSAFDGNKDAMGSGFFRQFRDAIEAHYATRGGTKTGWISDTCFEPKVGADLLKNYVAESGAKVWHGAILEEVLLEGKKIVGAKIRHDGALKEVRAKVTVDATEYGDVLNLAKVPFSLGREAKSETGEPDAIEKHDSEVQDLTFVATLKLHPGGAPPVPRPEGYDANIFDCSTSQICSTPDRAIVNHYLHDWESFLSYSTIPNDKHLLNWPFHANDSPDTLAVFGTREEREVALQAAKHRTLCYVHYMQNDLGHPEWGLATDEYGTADNLPHMPYMRESRRVYGVKKMMEQDVLPVGGGARAKFAADGVAAGDYYLDHHHSKAHLPLEKRLIENYPKNAPFQIPYGALVPREHDGLLAAEKNISVSHIVNGCTRLQPCVMLTGQAVGAAAALAAKNNIQPRAVDVNALQNILIEAGAAPYPTIDVHPSHPHFKSIQRLSMAGLRSDDDSIAFEPDSRLPEAEAKRLATLWEEASGAPAAETLALWKRGMKKGEFFAVIDAKRPRSPLGQ